MPDSHAAMRPDLVIPRHDLLIDGKRVPAASGRYFDSVNPATEEVIASIAEADAADVDAAVRSSRAAFEGEWGQMRAADRGAFQDVERRVSLPIVTRDAVQEESGRFLLGHRGYS